VNRVSNSAAILPIVFTYLSWATSSLFT